jgi:type I restriction enzyme M protein
MLANPPYGKSWKTDLDRLCGGNKKEMLDPRFVVEHGEDPEFPLVTRSSDGQLMFLVNMLSKMKHDSSMGSRVATIHNGSSLFTGDAGQGESNIRRWIIENDWLEAIIALPLNMFYNTGIATYIWVLSNRKPDHRKGKVQLIDATEWFRPLRKNLGKKNCELAPEHIKLILDTFMDCKDTEKSKVFPNEAFGYWKITVERPLRLRVDLTEERLEEFKAACAKDKEAKFCEMIVSELVDAMGEGPHMDFNEFMEAVKSIAKEYDLKLTAKRKKLLDGVLAAKNEDAAEVVKKRHKDGTIEYEPDSELRDIEQVPFLEEGGIQAFFDREVLPHAPDAWIDHGKTLIGYEVSFTRYFYKPQPLRTLDEIKADILALEQESEGLLDKIIGESQ